MKPLTFSYCLSYWIWKAIRNEHSDAEAFLNIVTWSRFDYETRHTRLSEKRSQMPAHFVRVLLSYHDAGLQTLYHQRR